MRGITESDVEAASVAWLAGLCGKAFHFLDIASDTPKAVRNDHGNAVLERRVQDVLAVL